jgi:hypothetical protein
VSSTFCVSDKEVVVPETLPEATYQHFESNPFTDRLGLARVGGNNRRSSIPSLSTFKIPRSFRPKIPRRGSSLYSRDTKGASVLPSPGLGSQFSISLKSLPEFDASLTPYSSEMVPKSLGSTPEHISAEDDVCPAASHKQDTRVPSVAGLIPQTPALHNPSTAPETPKIRTTSSNVFGARMPVPKISIASSSDDVFGSSPNGENSNDDVVIEDGRVFKRIRMMESKLSHEDLARYGGKTAPGGVEWV